MKYKIIIWGISLLTVITIVSFQNAYADTLVWDPGSGEIVGYRIYYGTTPNNYSKNMDVGKVTQYSLDSLPLQAGSAYYFAVKAYNATGESGFSNSVSWTAEDTTPPSPPQGLKAE